MYFKQFYDEDLAQGSYLIGCQKTGEAIVVDGRRDIQVFIDEAERNGLKITTVTETHIHADYLSGSRELAEATGATLYLSDEGDEDWKYGFEGIKLYDGDEIRVGNIVLKAVHTPGHTPEHLSFLVTDGATTDQPGFFLTGDFVFVGDIGRPDLLDEAAGGVDTRFEGAKRLFASLRDRFLTLPDYVQVWPAHGAGSACGKELGAVASTTVGYERNFSWWADYVRNGDEAGFTDELLSGQPDAPLYFGRMKRQNKAGPALLGERPLLSLYTPEELSEKLEQGAVFIDTRNREAFNAGHLPGSLHIPAGKRFATYASYIIDPERTEAPLIVLADSIGAANDLRDKLAYVGIDHVVGFASSLERLELTPADTVAPENLGSVDDRFILDVRTKNEHTEGHIPGATQLHAGRIVWNLGDLPSERPIVVHCQSGARATVAASALRAEGYEVYELEGSYEGWSEREPAAV